MSQFTHWFLIFRGIRDVLRNWAMVHKLRKAIGNRDARHTLERMIEFDEAYFTVESSEIAREKGVRGKGAVGKQNVAMVAET